MAGPIKIAILADGGNAQKALKDVGDGAEKMGKAVEGSGGKSVKGFDAVGKAAVGLNATLDVVSQGLSGLDSIMNAGRNKAVRLARAQADLEQATLDTEQATLDLAQANADGEQAVVDLRQATEDLNQAQLDGKQAAVDVEQARLDQKQADLDASEALKGYNEAVKEHGAKSAEARQAAIDLSQAKIDQKQATVDVTQAEADERQARIDVTQAQQDGVQATLDVKQATLDAKQATRDAKDAQLDLNDAQRELDPTPVQQAMQAVETYAPVLATAALAAQAMAAANVRATATAVASRAATIAGTVATGVMTAAQWALNVALSANPVGLVILAIVALVGVIILAWRRSETFRRIVTGAFNAVKSAASAAWNWVKRNWPLLLAIITGPIGLAVRWVVQNFDKINAKVRSIPGVIKGAFSGAGGWLRDAGRRVIQGFLDALRAGFDRVRGELNRLTNLIPDWKGPAARDRDLLKGPADLIMGGFADRLQSNFGVVQASLTGFTGDLGRSATIGASRAVLTSPAGGSTAGGVTVDFGPISSDPITRAIIAELRKTMRINGKPVTI